MLSSSLLIFWRAHSQKSLRIPKVFGIPHTHCYARESHLHHCILLRLILNLEFPCILQLKENRYWAAAVGETKMEFRCSNFNIYIFWTESLLYNYPFIQMAFLWNKQLPLSLGLVPVERKWLYFQLYGPINKDRSLNLNLILRKLRVREPLRHDGIMWRLIWYVTLARLWYPVFESNTSLNIAVEVFFRCD